MLAEGGAIHFKTDNDKLFEWSLEEIPPAGRQRPRSSATAGSPFEETYFSALDVQVRCDMCISG